MQLKDCQKSREFEDHLLAHKERNFRKYDLSFIH
jgi:hypothetical protein